MRNAFGILANRFGCLLATFKQQQKTTVESIVLAHFCLYEIMGIWYPPDKNGLIDDEDNYHNAIQYEEPSLVYLISCEI